MKGDLMPPPSDRAVRQGGTGARAVASAALNHWCRVIMALLVPLSLCAPCSTGTELTTLDTGESYKDVYLEPPDNDAIVNLSLPGPCVPLSAAMNLSTIPGFKSLSPVLDVGNDGTADWRFNGTGYGSLGLQTSFSDGSAELSLPVSTQSTASKSVKLPKSVSINSASLSFLATPAEPAPAQTEERGLELAPAMQRTFNISGIPQDASAINA
ncbi:MAG: hypothetical protein ACUVV6_04245, partial [Thermoplasmatota archaeon]